MHQVVGDELVERLVPRIRLVRVVAIIYLHGDKLLQEQLKNHPEQIISWYHSYKCVDQAIFFSGSMEPTCLGKKAVRRLDGDFPSRGWPEEHVYATRNAQQRYLSPSVAYGPYLTCFSYALKPSQLSTWTWFLRVRHLLPVSLTLQTYNSMIRYRVFLLGTHHTSRAF